MRTVCSERSTEHELCSRRALRSTTCVVGVPHTPKEPPYAHTPTTDLKMPLTTGDTDERPAAITGIRLAVSRWDEMLDGHAVFLNTHATIRAHVTRQRERVQRRIVSPSWLPMYSEQLEEVVASVRCSMRHTVRIAFETDHENHARCRALRVDLMPLLKPGEEVRAHV